jgi:hypothetical protein
MYKIGQYLGREIYWFNYGVSNFNLPDENWICLATSTTEPDDAVFFDFSKYAISKKLLEFKGHGKYGELLHDLFDFTIVDEEIKQGNEIDIMTTSHSDESLADAFWQCFVGTSLSENADLGKPIVVCTDLDRNDRIEELQNYVTEFELGWLPSYNIKHEVWMDSDGLPGLCLAGKKGNGFRQLLGHDSQLIHTFYSVSHFEAMNIYYKFMGWVNYEAQFEIDKEPYLKNGD